MKTDICVGIEKIALLVVSAGCEVSVNFGRVFTLPEGDPDRGKKAFVDLSGCTCHVVQGGNDLLRTVKTVAELLLVGGQAARVITYDDLVSVTVHPTHPLTAEFRGHRDGQSDPSPISEFTDAITARPSYTKLERLVDPYYGC